LRAQASQRLRNLGILWKNFSGRLAKELYAATTTQGTSLRAQTMPLHVSMGGLCAPLKIAECGFRIGHGSNPASLASEYGKQPRPLAQPARNRANVLYHLSAFAKQRLRRDKSPHHPFDSLRSLMASYHLY
jgi:hypothetical protein